MLLIDYVVELLKDGGWHFIQNIAKELNQPEQEILGILKFCEEFNIVAFDESGSRVRIDEKFGRLLE